MFICIPETRGRSLEEVALLLQRCAFTHARSFRQCSTPAFCRPGHAWDDAPMGLTAPAKPQSSAAAPVRHITEEDLLGQHIAVDAKAD